jgi:S-methylmethionine-dependent homocysteine/selenocysteine methylase
MLVTCWRGRIVETATSFSGPYHERWWAGRRAAARKGPGMSVAGEISGRLAAGELVIIDGGMGSQLQAEGVPMDEVAWSARANLEQPDVVQRVHEAYIRAGAEVIIANTFATSRAALAPAGLADRVAEANRSAVRAALRAREAAATRPVAVAGSMSSFCPIVMDPNALGAPLSGPAAGDPRFPGLADFREQAALLAEAGADLIALEMIDGQGYGGAALQAAAETGLPVWLGISPDRLGDGTLGTFPELGDGDSFEELLGALVDPALAAVTVMHADPEVTLDAMEIIRRRYSGPIGVYAETGNWQPPNWVFDGLAPGEYLQQATIWAGHGAQLIGGCCGTGPAHIRALADGLARRTATS